jgi:hypothetical protein
MKNFISKLILGLVVVAFYASCEDKVDPPVPTPVNTTNTGEFKAFTIDGVTTVQNLIADTIVAQTAMGPVGKGRFTFFNIATSSLVANADSATTKWDLGFRGTTIITNAGKSGIGKGGAFVFNGLFDNLKTISADSVFRIDNQPISYAIPSGSKKGWYNYDGPTNLITPLAGKVLVIRTADGKYAKVEILNYYKKGVTPASTASDSDKSRLQRFYNFRLVYQADGSKTFAK